MNAEVSAVLCSERTKYCHKCMEVTGNFSLTLSIHNSGQENTSVSYLSRIERGRSFTTPLDVTEDICMYMTIIFKHLYL